MPLRLKSLELQGYKTFAARTFFEFAAGITAVVGPNGAGKSNIADALRWVLGEQSYSLLRGKKTEDMIFAGSEHRPRSGMASAEIVFDNSANWLPVDFAEVSITRRAYRDGHNDYLLNSQHVRLRDMNELLAASGLSERTYTIVGQGLVDASLALKADERRRLFEEAAGVGLYRVRREEAIKRLEITLHNLERVQDIMAELEPRLKSLERQARRAKEYGAAQSDLRAVLREWYGYHWHQSQQQLQEAQAQVRSARARADSARAVHEKAQTEVGEFRARLLEMRAQLNAWHRELSELYQQRDTVSRDLAVLDERRRSMTAAHAEMANQLEATNGELELARGRLTQAEAESGRMKIELDEAQAQVALAQEALQTRQSGRGAIESELENARETVALTNTEKAEAKARLDELAARLEAYSSRGHATALDISNLEATLKDAERALQDHLAILGSSEAALRKGLSDLEDRKARVLRAEEKQRALVGEHTGIQSRHSRLQAQVEIIEQAELTLAGYAEGARYLLEATRQSRLKTHGALSSILDLPAELETAVTAALGDTLDTVMLDASEVEAALQLLDAGAAGRAAVLPLNGHRIAPLDAPQDPEVVGVASDLVKCRPEFRQAVEVLLGSTLIARSRAAASRLASKIPSHARIVTLQGEVFRGDGLILAGRPAASSALSRPRQKRELAASLEESKAQLEAASARIQAASGEVGAASENLAALESDIKKLRQTVEEQRTHEQALRLEAERHRRNLEWSRSRQAELAREISAAEEGRQRAVAALEECDLKLDRARGDERRLLNAMNDMSLEEVRAQATYWSTRVAVIDEGYQAAEARRQDREESIPRLQRQVVEQRSRLEESAAGLRASEAERSALLERESALHAEVAAKQARAEPAERDLEGAELAEANLQASESEAQKKLSVAEHALSEAQIDLVRRQESLETVRGRIIDDFGLVSFQYAESVEGPVPLPFEGLVEALPLVTEISPDLEEQLRQRRAHLRRLGLINPEAAKEYDAEAERYTFMTVQVHDLRQAEADLRQVIAELDELTRQEFSRTYYAVDKQFREIFTRLFGGGTAHLSLTDPSNLVETGIEIEARLPGRREQGLSLLSGGERSLTAIALVFALLKVSPTPVCVMDEVDAMLDEANVGRFRDLLQELSQDTQFIIITHNRNTVQAADFIYGVTMGRDSASQVISLKLDEISEEMLGTSRT